MRLKMPRVQSADSFCTRKADIGKSSLFWVRGKILIINSFPGVTSSVSFPSAAPYLDPRFPRPAINASLVPQHRSALLLGTISRVLGFGYPPVPAHVTCTRRPSLSSSPCQPLYSSLSLRTFYHLTAVREKSPAIMSYGHNAAFSG